MIKNQKIYLKSVMQWKLFFIIFVILNLDVLQAHPFASLLETNRNRSVDENLQNVLTVSAATELGIYGKDIQIGLQNGLVLQSEWVNISWSMPLQMKLLNESKTDSFSQYHSGFCSSLSCREWYDANGSFMPVYMLRSIESLELFPEIETFSLRLGAFKTTAGHGLSVDHLNHALIWEQRNIALDMNISLFSDSLKLRWVNSNLLKPHQMNIGSVTVNPFRFLDFKNEGYFTRLLESIEFSTVLTSNLTLLNGERNNLFFWEYGQINDVISPVTAVDGSIRFSVLPRNDTFQIKPILGTSLQYGLPNKIDQSAEFGSGFVVGSLFESNNPWISFMLDLRLLYSLSHQRFSLFSSYVFAKEYFQPHIDGVENNRFGGRLELNTLVFDHLRFGTRFLIEQNSHDSLIELFSRLQFYGFNMGFSWLTPYFSYDLLQHNWKTTISESIIALDLSAIIFGPISIYMRAENALNPLYRNSKKLIPGLGTRNYELRLTCGFSGDIGFTAN